MASILENIQDAVSTIGRLTASATKPARLSLGTLLHLWTASPIDKASRKKSVLEDFLQAREASTDHVKRLFATPEFKTGKEFRKYVKDFLIQNKKKIADCKKEGSQLKGDELGQAFFFLTLDMIYTEWSLQGFEKGSCGIGPFLQLTFQHLHDAGMNSAKLWTMPLATLAAAASMSVHLNCGLLVASGVHSDFSKNAGAKVILMRILMEHCARDLDLTSSNAEASIALGVGQLIVTAQDKLATQIVNDLDVITESNASATIKILKAKKCLYGAAELIGPEIMSAVDKILSVLETGKDSANPVGMVTATMIVAVAFDKALDAGGEIVFSLGQLAKCRMKDMKPEDITKKAKQMSVAYAQKISKRKDAQDTVNPEFSQEEASVMRKCHNRCTPAFNNTAEENWQEGTLLHSTHGTDPPAWFGGYNRYAKSYNVAPDVTKAHTDHALIGPNSEVIVDCKNPDQCFKGRYPGNAYP